MQPLRTAICGAAAALLAASFPAFAGPPGPGWTVDARPRHVAPRGVRYYAPRVADRRAVVVYRAPMTTGTIPAAYGWRGPAYRVRREDAAAGAFVGAVAGALIGGSLASGEQRLPAVAFGSVLGAIIGHELVGSE
jgi:hypothetical protein